MVPPLASLPLLLIAQLPTAGLAPAPVEERPAKAPAALEVNVSVMALQPVAWFQLTDPFVGWYEPDVDLPAGSVLLTVQAPACRVLLRAETSLTPPAQGPDVQARFGQPLDVHGPPGLCQELKLGQRFTAQAFGAGADYRVIALRPRDTWIALPWMYLSTSAPVQSCLKGTLSPRPAWCPEVRRTGDAPKRRPW